MRKLNYLQTPLSTIKLSKTVMFLILNNILLLVRIFKNIIIIFTELLVNLNLLNIATCKLIVSEYILLM